MPIHQPRPPAPEEGPPSYLPVYRASLHAAGPEVLERATIHVENIPEVLLVTGGDDQVWPSDDFARAKITRRASRGRDTTHVHLPEAGHRTILPREQAPTGGRPLARGGTPKPMPPWAGWPWPHVRQTLRLN